MTTLAEPPRAAPTGSTSRRRWLIVGTAAWVLVLLATVYVSVRRDAPTVREQRSIAQAAPVVDRAAAEIARAARPEAVAVLSPRRLTPGCRITSARDGAELEREVALHAPAGDAPALLDRLRQRLPESYAVRLRSGDDGRPDALRADAGEFVGLRGTTESPGVVRFVVATGCRPQSPGFDAEAENALGYPADDVPGPILAALGAAPGPPSGTTAGCAGGGAVHTATAEGRPAAAPGRLSTAAPPPAGAAVLIDEPDRFAYRAGDIAVVVEKIGDLVRASATTAC